MRQRAVAALGVDVSDILDAAALRLRFDETHVRREVGLVEDANGRGLRAVSRRPLEIVPGRTGPALRLPGESDQALEVSPPPRMNERSVTFALWLSPAGVAPSTWLCQVSPPGGFELWTKAGWLIWGAPALALAVTIWPACLYHVVVVVDGLQQRLYVDGERVGEATGALSLSESAPLLVGAGSAGLAHGLVEEVLVDRALSDVEVLALYARTSPPWPAYGLTSR
jgi:hypothetical protein